MVTVMQVIVLDQHPMEDGRVNRHINYLIEKSVKTYRIHINRSDQTLSEGYFSTFGEDGYRLNIESATIPFKNTLRDEMYLCTKSFYERIRIAIKKLNIKDNINTIIHVHDPVLLTLAVKLKLTKFDSAKIVYDRHEVYESKKDVGFLNMKIPRIARFYEIVARKNIDGIVSVSQEHNASIHVLFPETLIYTVQNFPSIHEYDKGIIENKLINIPNKNIKLIYVGSLRNSHDRDIDLLLKIFEVVLNQFPTAHCYIGGRCDDNLRYKFSQLKEQYEGRFEYFGEMPRNDVVKLTESAHIGFLLIRPETSYWVLTSPNKTYEYLICGVVPIIRANVEHVNDYSNCSLIFDRYTPEGLIIKAVIDLLNDTDRLHTMMEDAYMLSKKFIFENVAGKYLLLYESLFRTNRMDPII